MRDSYRQKFAQSCCALTWLAVAPLACQSTTPSRVDAQSRRDAAIDASSTDVGATVDVASDTTSIGPLGPPYVTPIDDAMAAHIRSILATGATMGNRPNVFSKIGDSITESQAFLFDLGQGWDDLGAYTAMQPTVAYFSSVALPDSANSFTRFSECATHGWMASDAIAGGASSPLMTELLHVHPSYAIVMYGTNDLDHGTLATYLANMQTLVGMCEQEGVVPIVSTIPDRADAPDKEPLVLQFNAALRSFAASQHLPMIDFWAALQGLPGHGLSSDGVHPNVYMMGTTYSSCYFTDAGLQYGYNVRNWTALAALDLMHRTFP